ncbi:MAG: hypothetical protein NVSMB45_06130 [Ginsengibacter sp.]
MTTKNIDLKLITPDHLKGYWNVFDRTVNKTQSDEFSSINVLDIQSNFFRSLNGKITEGQYEIFRESEIIYNPQIKFYSNNSEIGNAIITRLFIEEQSNKFIHKLTLYFSSGLELILKKEEKLNS